MYAYDENDMLIALDLVDNSILGEYLHVNEETCSMARGIWKKMQHRRLKRG